MKARIVQLTDLHLTAREGPRAFLERRAPNFTAEWIDLQYDKFVPYDVSKK